MDNASGQQTDDDVVHPFLRIIITTTVLCSKSSVCPHNSARYISIQSLRATGQARKENRETMALLRGDDDGGKPEQLRNSH